MWAELHARPAAYQGDREAEAAWMVGWRLRILCEKCWRHWQEMEARTPPDFSSPIALFIWGVGRHNEVNRQLGKREMSIGEAADVWGFCL
jgi:hypothetical protein